MSRIGNYTNKAFNQHVMKEELKLKFKQIAGIDELISTASIEKLDKTVAALSKMASAEEDLKALYPTWKGIDINLSGLNDLQDIAIDAINPQ